MSIHIVHFRTDPSDVSAVEQGIAELFRAVADAMPTGLDYRAFRLGERPVFVLALEVPDGAPNPLLAVDEARTFRGLVARWAGEPVPPVELVPLGSYSA